MYDFDSLFRDYLTQCEEYGSIGTLDKFIQDCIANTQDSDDPVSYWVTQYVIDRDQSDPGWQGTYCLPE